MRMLYQVRRCGTIAGMNELPPGSTVRVPPVLQMTPLEIQAYLANALVSLRQKVSDLEAARMPCDAQVSSYEVFIYDLEDFLGFSLPRG